MKYILTVIYNVSDFSEGANMSNRDDFSLQIKRSLSDRVAGKCSNPDCQVSTKGPSNSLISGVSNIGVAAHICAAASGGPRYDETMTREERSSIENGIWLCQNCAQTIDSDSEKYPVGILKLWKASAEASAERNLGKRSSEDGLNKNDEIIIKNFCDLIESNGIKNILKEHDFANSFDISSMNQLFYWLQDYFDQPSRKVQNKLIAERLEKLFKEILIFSYSVAMNGGPSRDLSTRYIIDREVDQQECNSVAKKIWEDYEIFVEFYQSYKKA